MTLDTIIQERQSVRKYSNKVVEKDKILQCIEAARLAPSASNSQPWTFVVVDQNGPLAEVAKATKGPLMSFNRFTDQVPVILVMVLERPNLLNEMGGRLKKKEYPLIDIGIAAEHFCLKATELGLGTCMLGWFDEKAIQELLQIPTERTIGLLITLGYAPDDYSLRKKVRKSMDEVLRWNKY